MATKKSRKGAQPLGELAPTAMTTETEASSGVLEILFDSIKSLEATLNTCLNTRFCALEYQEYSTNGSQVVLALILYSICS
jgi:hypothetical protein